MRSLIWLVSPLVIGAGCSGPECVDDGQCTGGQACVEEQCVDVECLDSTTCELETYCDTVTHTCVDGCLLDDDCPAGTTCDDGTCEAYGCRETDLDCEFGEICDDGECETADGPHCDPCDDPYFGSGCGSDGWCYAFNEMGTENYCLMNCTPGGDECPRGYECTPDNDGYYSCFAWCPTVNEFD